jgi:hypothetical protein
MVDQKPVAARPGGVPFAGGRDLQNAIAGKPDCSRGIR